MFKPKVPGVVTKLNFLLQYTSGTRESTDVTVQRKIIYGFGGDRQELWFLTFSADKLHRMPLLRPMRPAANVIDMAQS